MRLANRSRTIVVLGVLCLAFWSVGCAKTSSTPPTPVKDPEPVYAMVDIQKVLDAHPERARLRKMEQALSAMDAAAQDKSPLLEVAKTEFEAAMKIRQNQDRAMIEKKQAELTEQLNGERRQFIEKLEAEYRPLLFNIDLKLKSLQNSPTESQALQQEKARLENERQQKLKNKEDELVASFQSEMKEFSQALNAKSEAYAKKWMDDRMQELQKPIVSPEREKQRQEIVALSGRMMQDVRNAVAVVAEREKIELVWLKPAVRKSVKDITELVTQEITKAK